MIKEELEIYESPAVIKHLDMLQGIISRMAGNSAACKTWALPIITGIIAFSLSEHCIPIWISLIPAIMFFALDALYLGLERHFIGKQREFVAMLSDKTIKNNDIYVIASKRSFVIHMGFIVAGMKSFATYFFYLPIIATIVFLIIMGF